MVMESDGCYRRFNLGGRASCFNKRSNTTWSLEIGPFPVVCHCSGQKRYRYVNSTQRI